MTYAPMTEKVLNYIKERFDAEPEFLWARTPYAAAIRHRGDHKWFAAVMFARPKKIIGLEGEATIDILNVKCDPKLIGSLRDGKRILPGYHMSKEHWITIVLDGSLPLEEITPLIELSYELTRKKCKVPKQETLANLEHIVYTEKHAE